MEKCAICGEEAIKTGNGYYSPMSYYKTCEAHGDDSIFNMLEVVQKELGYRKAYSDKMKKCSICNCELTKEEIEKIHKEDQRVCCTKHSEVRKIHQSDFDIRWFNFKEIYKEADLTNFVWVQKYREHLRALN